MQSLDKVKALLDEKYKDCHHNRYEHILGVVEMAEFLAKRYGVDVEKAKIAAYMHDYSKYDSYDVAREYLTEDEYNDCLLYPFLFHAYLSAYMYKKYVGDDEEIFNAIYNHVFGRPNMSKLEEIIMIADYTEKNRKYPSCIECRHILVDDNDMDLAIYESTKRTIEHAIEEGQKPHPRQLLVLKEYEERILKR